MILRVAAQSPDLVAQRREHRSGRDPPFQCRSTGEGFPVTGGVCYISRCVIPSPAVDGTISTLSTLESIICRRGGAPPRGQAPASRGITCRTAGRLGGSRRRFPPVDSRLATLPLTRCGVGRRSPRMLHQRTHGYGAGMERRGSFSRSSAAYSCSCSRSQIFGGRSACRISSGQPLRPPLFHRSQAASTANPQPVTALYGEWSRIAATMCGRLEDRSHSRDFPLGPSLACKKNGKRPLQFPAFANAPSGSRSVRSSLCSDQLSFDLEPRARVRE